MEYKELEQQKAEAWRLLGDVGASQTIKAQALLRVIEAHYLRARDHLESLPKSEQRRIHGRRYYHRYRLDIDVYTRHWLYANGHIISQEVVDAVRREWGYEPESSPFLAKGKTSYAIPNAKAKETYRRNLSDYDAWQKGISNHDGWQKEYKQRFVDMN